LVAVCNNNSLMIVSSQSAFQNIWIRAVRFSESSLALSLEGKGDSPWNDERTSLLSGQAIQNLDMPWNDERTSLLSGQAIQIFWDKPSLGASIFHMQFDAML